MQQAPIHPELQKRPLACANGGAMSSDPAHFRSVLGNVATSVAIVSGVDGDEAFGMVVGSFVSISLDPPLVGLFVDDRSSTLPSLLKAGELCINVLSADHGAFCRDFAKDRAARFACGNWHRDPGAPPRLATALAWIAGPVERAVEVGDHMLIVIEARELSTNSSQADSAPLVFFRGGFVECAGSGA